MHYLIIVFTVFWIILSERLTIESLIVGIVVILGVLYFNKSSIGSLKSNKSVSLKKLKLFILYVVVLIKDILIANIHVAKIVLAKELKISPMFVRINTRIRSDLSKVVYANSITLTPGTLTVMLEKDTLLVHCLEEKSAEGLKNSGFEKIIMEVEK